MLLQEAECHKPIHAILVTDKPREVYRQTYGLLRSRLKYAIARADAEWSDLYSVCKRIEALEPAIYECAFKSVAARNISDPLSRPFIQRLELERIVL